MKKKFLFFSLFIVSFVFGQNNFNVADGILVKPTIGTVTTGIPTLSAIEAFRFRTGAVTQLDTGSTFDFATTSKWFSLGKFTTPGQSLYGLRIQDKGKGLVFGYSTATGAILAGNPFIQYIGNGADNSQGNLEIRTASNPTNPASDVLVATFRSDATTLFGNTGFAAPNLTGKNAQVDIRSQRLTGLNVSAGFPLPIGSSFVAANFQGDVFVNGINILSDATFKKEVKTEETNIFDKINALNPVSYLYKLDNKHNMAFSNKLQHGFIAQELQRVYPELVTTVKDENGDYLAVNYVGLVSILTKGMQVLNEKIEQLESTRATTDSDLKRKNSSIDVKENNLTLEQNVPNPFSDQTQIKYAYPAEYTNVNLSVFDLTGKLIKNFKLKEKSGTITINASDIGKGMFLYSLITNNEEVVTKKMIIN